METDRCQRFIRHRKHIPKKTVCAQEDLRLIDISLRQVQVQGTVPSSRVLLQKTQLHNYEVFATDARYNQTALSAG